MSARAGNSIRSARPSMGGSATRRDGAPQNGTTVSSGRPGATARSPQRTHAASALPPPASREPQPASPSPPTAAPQPLQRPVAHSRNIPFHRGSARSGLPKTVLPPAVMPPRSQRGTSEPPAVPATSNGDGRPRASSYNVTPQQVQQQQQQQQQRVSPRQQSAQTTLNSSSFSAVGLGPAPSSAPAPYPLPRERGVYPAPHSAARPSPAPRQRSSSNERLPYPSSAHHGKMVGERPPPPRQTATSTGAPPSHPPPSSPQYQRTQPSPSRVQPRGGGVYLESMDPIRPARGTPPPQPTSNTAHAPHSQQQQERWEEYPSGALVLRPSPPSTAARRDHAREDIRDRGTGTENLEAYAQPVQPRRPQQQQRNPAYYSEDVPESYALTPYQTPQHQHQQQQQQVVYAPAARRADYYALAPSLRLGLHRHVRHVAPRAPQQPQQQYTQQQQQQYQPPPQQQQQLMVLPTPAASPVSRQHDPELSSTSFISDTGSTRSSRTRQVFRRQPFATGALPTGSPYGARPTYAVVMPRTHRVPAGLYSHPAAPQKQQQAHQQRSDYLIDVEPTVEEPYYVTEGPGGRVVEYEPVPPPQQQQQPQRRLPAAPQRVRPADRVPAPLPQHPHQQQVYAEHPVQRRAPPPPPPVQYVAVGPPMRQVIRYYPAPQQQQEVYEPASMSDDGYTDNSYSYDQTDDSGWKPAAPTQHQHQQQQQQRRHPPPPPPPPAQTVKTKRRAKQRVPPPPPPQPDPILEQQQQQQQRHRHPDRAAPGVAHHINNDYDDYDGEAVHTYPTRYELQAAARRRPSAQDQSEQPSSATLAAPLQPGYRLGEHSPRLDPGTAASNREDAHQQQQQQKRRRGSPPAGRRPRPPPPQQQHQSQHQLLRPRPKPDSADTSAGRPDDMYVQSLSTYTEAAPARHHSPPPPPPQTPAQVRQQQQPPYEEEEEYYDDESPPTEQTHQTQQPQQQQQTRLSERPSLSKDQNESLSFDLDSTVDPEDVLAQQEAKKLADELVRRSLLPPTPYVAPQAMDGPAPYSDEEGEGEDAPVEAQEEANQQPEDPANAVVVPLSAAAPPAETEEPQPTPSAVVAQASVMSVDSEVPHSVHVAFGKEVDTVDPSEGTASLRGLALTAPERSAAAAPRAAQEHHPTAPVQAPTPLPPEEMAGTSATEAEASVAEAPTIEKDNSDSLRDAQQVSHEDATELDIDVSASSREELDEPPSLPQQPRHSSDADVDAPQAEDTLRPTASASGDRAAVAQTMAQLATPRPQPPAAPPRKAEEHVPHEAAPAGAVVDDEDAGDEEPQPQPPHAHTHAATAGKSAAIDGVDDDDDEESPLEVGDRYGYVDPLEEAAMDAAYMLDTLEDQYVRINEETGEEMEDLVHVVELNRFDRAVEPRYFLPKGQYSDVLPLLRYPVTAVPTIVAPGEELDGSVPDLLTYVPLTEAGYINLCAVIWLSRFNRDDIPRLLALTQGPVAQQQQASHQELDEEMLAQACYFDHPSATVVDLLDSVTEHRVRSVIDDGCAHSGESFATACARLADRNNLAYLPPSVWQQTTTASTLCVTSMADHVTEVLLAATVPQEATRRQAARRATLTEAERHAQKTWPLFLGALPWDTEEAVEAETYAAMPTASARLAYAFMYKARLVNLDGGLGALTFSALSAQIPDAAVMDSLLMQEKLRLALLYSYKNVAACCALRQRAVKRGCVSSSLCNSQVNERDDSNSRDEGSHLANANGWNSPVFSAYLQLWEGAKNAANATPADSLPLDKGSAAGGDCPTESHAAVAAAAAAAMDGGADEEGEDEDVVDLYSVAVQLNCFFPTKTERGMHQLCAALIEDLIAMGALMVPEEVRTPEGAVLTDQTAIIDALVVEGAQAMRHVIMTLSEAGYTSTISTDDFVGPSGRIDKAALRAAMESHCVLFEPGVMYFLSSPVPVDALFRYTLVDGPPSMQPHTRGRKSTFVEVLRLQHVAETIQYAMEMQDAILVASQYNHLVAVHRKRIKQQQQKQQGTHNTRATPRTLAEELQMDAVVVGQSMDLILNAAPLLAREHGSDASLLAELGNGEGRGAEEDVMLGQEEDEAAAAANGEEVSVRAVLVALCCADPMKPVGDVQEYLRHLLTLYAEVRDAQNNPIDTADPLQVSQARVAAAELAMVDWFGQTAADGTLMPGAQPARCDETRINAEQLAALCPRVLSRRVGLASSAVADAAAVISASAGQHPRPAAAGGDAGVEDSVLLADTTSRPPRAR